MSIQFRTRIFLAISLILILALSAMFLASTATIRQPLTEYIDAELERVYRNLESVQKERIHLLITQAKLYAEKQDIWLAAYTLITDPFADAQIDPDAQEVPTQEGVREQAINTIRDQIEVTLQRYRNTMDPAFILAMQPDGEILVSIGNGPPEGENASQYPFWSLQNNPIESEELTSLPHRRSTPFLYNHKLYQVTLEPIQLEGEPLVGYICLGFQMDSATIGSVMETNVLTEDRQKGIREIYVCFISQEGNFLASNVPAEIAEELEEFVRWEFTPVSDPNLGLNHYGFQFNYQGEEMTGQYWTILDVESNIIAYEMIMTSKTKALSFLNELTIDFLIISLIALITTGIVGYFVSRSVTKPVDQLVYAANQLTAGNLKHQVHYRAQDEIGMLADAFEHMRVALLHRIQELADLNASLEQKVQERTAELRQAMENLKQAESHLVLSEKMVALGQMVSGIAHEINNPINYIRNGVKPLQTAFIDLKELLRNYDHCELSSEDRKRIEQIKSEIDLDVLMQDIEDLNMAIAEGAERTLQIVSDLRTFSRKDETNFQKTDIHEGIESSLNILRHELKDRVDVIREYGSLPPVMCNLGQLNQVFLNLINNAQQAIEGKGTITIRTMQQDGQAQISIHDTGKGIPPENLNKIFEPFFTTKEIGHGTGLGLSISYGIVQRHGGRFEVSSTLGEGTEFRIIIPIKGPTKAQRDNRESPILFAAPSKEESEILR